MVPNHFFLLNKLYRKIRVVKSEDYVVAWSYEDEMRQRFNYSSVRREATKAYELKEVSQLIGRRSKDILLYMSKKLVEYPSGRSYNKNKIPMRWYWSEQDIIDLRDAIFDMAPKNKYGEPYVNFKLISKSDLLAKMRQDTSYYIRNENGDYVKVWRAS